MFVDGTLRLLLMLVHQVCSCFLNYFSWRYHYLISFGIFLALLIGALFASSDYKTSLIMIILCIKTSFIIRPQFVDY